MTDALISWGTVLGMFALVLLFAAVCAWAVDRALSKHRRMEESKRRHPAGARFVPPLPEEAHR